MRKAIVWACLVCACTSATGALLFVFTGIVEVFFVTAVVSFLMMRVTYEQKYQKVNTYSFHRHWSFENWLEAILGAFMWPMCLTQVINLYLFGRNDPPVFLAGVLLFCTLGLSIGCMAVFYHKITVAVKKSTGLHLL